MDIRRFLIWLAYALVWLWLIVFAVNLVVAILATALGPTTNLSNWAFVAYLGVIALAWMAVLWRRLPLMSPLVTVFLFLVLLLAWPLVGSVVTTIGLAKFAIEAAGRRNVFGGSRLGTRKPIVRPSGLVEHKSYDNSV